MREIRDEVAQVLHVFVSHVTIWNWCMKLIAMFILWASLLDTDYEKSGTSTRNS
ncbi:MAG: hypothetical protein AABX16_01125 [Nanoarchaeota archaeon]